MKMQFIPANSMSVLFDTNVDTERMPEPFRLQHELALSISYSEYLSFVHSLSPDSLINLYPSTQSVLESLHTQSVKNYQGYLMNVAFAIFKELHFATKYNMQPTLYLPTYDSPSSVSWMRCVNVGKLVWQDTSHVDVVLDQYDLYIRPTSDYATSLWRLAVYLFKVAKNVSTEGAINLTL